MTNGREWTGADDAVLAPMSGWLLDGQQRVTAIRDFIQDSFAVKAEQTIRFWNQPFLHFELEYIADDDDGMQFLRLWNQGDFDVIRSEWPEAPEEVFIGADPLHKPSK